MVETLVGKEIDDLCENDFEGSNDERRIFRECFFNNDTVPTNDKCLVTGVVNFECESSKNTDTSLCCNSENSVITSHSSSKITVSQDFHNVTQNCKETLHTGILPHKLAYKSRNDEDADVKRMKFSLDEFFCTRSELTKTMYSSEHSTELLSDTLSPPTDSCSKTVTFHLVESSNHGVSSSCYLLKQKTSLVEANIKNCKLTGSDGSQAKEVAGSKAVASPVSQESFATRLLLASPSFTAVEKSESTVAEKCGSPSHAKATLKGFHSSDLDVSNTSLKPELLKDLRSVLQHHIVQLLIVAGWSIEKRKRPSRRYMESVYRTPEGRPIREFPKVWRLCGQLLSADENNLVQEDDCKVWTDISQFLSDLSSTLISIEKETNQSETTMMLAHWWRLLDPFVIVILIERKIGVLKRGEAVKVTSSLVYAKNNASSDCMKVDCSGAQYDQKQAPALLCDSSTATTSAITVSEGNHNACVQNPGDGNLSACCEQTNNGAPKLLTGVSVSMSSREDVHLVDNGNSMGEQFLGISASKTSSLDLASLPDCGLDNTCILLNACRYNVPVTYGNCMSLHGGPETSSSREGDCKNSQRSDKQSSRHNLETLMEDEGDVEMINTVDQSALVEVQVIDTVGSYLQGSLDGHPCCTGDDVVYSHDAEAVCQSQLSEENVGESSGISECETKNACAAADVNMKKKVRRKCKKISEIKLSMLYQSDMLGSTFGDKVHLKKRSSKFKKSLPNLSGSRTGKRKYSGCQIEDDDLLVSAIIKNKDFSLSATRSSREESCKSRAFRKRKSKKGHCRLLPRSLGNGGKHFKDDKLHFMGARTVLSWLIDTGVISINDVIQYRNSKDDAVTKDGLVSRDGIICKCCSKVLTISEFKIHAGFRLNRPCLNLFMESGEPFTLCLLRAWSAEYKARKSGNQVVRTDENDKNDDSCGLCGDGGELICCDNCPSTFHQACLCTKDLPEGSWYCTNCTCHICGNLVNDKDALSSFDGFQCSQCERKYHEMCLREKGMHGGAVSDTWFCGGSCQEVYSGLQSRVGFINHSADGFSWMLVRCIHDDQRIHSAQWFSLKADCNSRLAVALTIMEECFLSMVDPRTGINMIPQLLYNWGSNFARLDFHGFYTMVLEKDDVIITVASIRVHGTTVAEMPLIATCSRYRRQGMCRRLMSAIEEMLMSFKVEKLVISAIPDLVETWTKGFGFKPVDNFEKQNLKKINLMVFPGTVLLKKPLYENQKVDQESPLKIVGTRQCPSSPLRTDGTTEVAISLKGGSMAERVQQCVVNTCNGVSGDSETKLSKGKTLPEPEATLEVDSNGQPVKTSLETEGPAEVGNCFRGEEIIEFVKQPDKTMPMNGKSQRETEVGSRMLIVDKAVHQFSGNHCTNNNGAESEGRLIADQNIRVGDRVENTLQDHFSKLSCKTLGGSNHDMDLNVESSGMYDERQLSWEQQ